jgi:hypothetical protein
LGRGHLDAIVAITTEKHNDAEYYRRNLGKSGDLSHITIEVSKHASSG